MIVGKFRPWYNGFENMEFGRQNSIIVAGMPL